MQSDSEYEGKLLIVSTPFSQGVGMLGEEPAARLMPQSLQLPGWVFMLIVWACLVPILSSCGNVFAQTEPRQTDASSDSCPARLIPAQESGGSRSLQAPAIGSTFQTLTEEERTWLSRHPVIRVVQDPGWPPIEFADEQGESVGITSDYLTLIEQRLGITFDRVRNLSWQEAYTRLKRWDIDMTTSVAVTPERSEFWAFTEAYMKIPIVVLTRTDVTFIASMRELRGKEVAVVEGYAVCDWLPRDFPDIQLVRVKNTKEGLDRLVRGDVYAFIDNMLVVGYYLAKSKVANVKIAGETPYVNSQSMAVRKDWALLAGILQKAIDSIPERERDEIYQKWVPLRYEHGVDYTTLWQALGIFALILLCLGIWNRRLTNEIKCRERAEGALRESEQQLKAMFATASVGVAQADPSTGQWLRVNKKLCEITGYSPGEMLAMRISEITHPEDRERDWQRFQDVINGKSESYRLEKRYIRKDGNIVWVNVNMTVTRDSDGQPTQTMATIEDISDRKRADEALRESETLFRNLFECHTAVKLIIDPDNGNIVDANQAAENFYGWPRKMLKEMKVQDINTLPSEKVKQAMEQVRSLKGVHFQMRHRRADGSVRYVEVFSSKFEVKGKDFLHSIVHDITERKNAEEALQHKTEELQRFFDVALDLLCIADTSGNFRRLNQAWERTLGFASEELMAGRFYEFIHPDDLESTLDVVAKLTRQEDVVNFVNRYRCKDGSYRWIEWRATPVGELIYAAARDITSRIVAEEALRESNSKLEAALASMTDAVCISDIEGRFLDFNHAFATFHKFKNKEDCLKTLSEYPRLLEVLDSEGQLAPMDQWAIPRAMRGETATNAEYTLRRKDTGETWVGSYSFGPIRDKDGAIVGSVLAGRDITELKRAETALRSSLEEKVSLLKEVHHRVKNNLQIVASLLSLQSSRIEDSHTLEVLQDTRARVRSMALLHEVLYRSENLAHINFAIYSKELITHLLRSLGPAAPRVKLDNRIGSIGLPLEQSVPCGLITNELVSNALKHGFPNGRSGMIRLELVPTGGGMLSLSVSDDGVGLPPGFNPERTSTLGLRLVAGLAKQLNGELIVKKGGDKGSLFSVVFPAPENTISGEP